MIALLVTIFFLLTPNLHAGNEDSNHLMKSLPPEITSTFPRIETTSVPYSTMEIKGIPTYGYTRKGQEVALSEKVSGNKDFIQLIESCSNKIQKNSKKYELIPIELVLSQSILESNWGKSRFAIEGNNFFGMRTWDPDRPQLKPLENPDADFGLVVYESACDSISDYIYNLNTSDKYKTLRKIRKIELALWGKIDSVRLADGLQRYSEQGNLYIDKVKEKILFLREKNYKD